MFTLTNKGAEFHGCLQGEDFAFFREHKEDVAEFLVVLWLSRFQRAGGKIRLDEVYRKRLIFDEGGSSPEAKVLSQARVFVVRYLNSNWHLPDSWKGSAPNGSQK